MNRIREFYSDDNYIYENIGSKEAVQTAIDTLNLQENFFRFKRRCEAIVF